MASKEKSRPRPLARRRVAAARRLVGRAVRDAADGEERSPDRHEQILAAGLRVFSESGYAAANLKGIADEAGLNSAQLLYWYFPSKRDLFNAVVIRASALVRNLFAGLGESHDDPRVHLEQFARGFIGAFDDPHVVQTFRLLLDRHSQVPGISIDEVSPDNVFVQLGGYLKEQMKQGRIAPGDADLMARVFVTMVFGYVHGRYFIPTLARRPRKPDEWIRGVVSIFLDGCLPRQRKS
jgi:AcrR family transcriptional regulator